MLVQVPRIRHHQIDRRAIKIDGQVYSYPYPATYSNIISMMHHVYGLKIPVLGTHGYLTRTGDFIDQDRMQYVAWRSEIRSFAEKIALEIRSGRRINARARA